MCGSALDLRDQLLSPRRRPEIGLPDPDIRRHELESCGAQPRAWHQTDLDVITYEPWRRCPEIGRNTYDLSLRIFGRHGEELFDPSRASDRGQRIVEWNTGIESFRAPEAAPCLV